MTVAAYRVDRIPAGQEMPTLPEGGTGSSRPWISRWEHWTERESVYVAVKIFYSDGRVETTDARDFIERLHLLGRAVGFEIHLRSTDRGPANSGRT